MNNRSQRFLMNTAEQLDLPKDIIARVSKMELAGFEEFSIEVHKGLVEYDRSQISIETEQGMVYLYGRELKISLMNRCRITIKGRLFEIGLGEKIHA